MKYVRKCIGIIIWTIKNANPINKIDLMYTDNRLNKRKPSADFNNPKKKYNKCVQ